MLSGGQRPRIPSPWRVRNDGVNTIVYRCATDALSFKVCTPAEASIVPFLSGEFSCEEIFAAWSAAVAGAGVAVRTDLRSLFDTTLDGLSAGAELVVVDGPASPSFDADVHLFPDFTAYRHPVARLQRPIAVNVAMTNRCVCDCVYCYAERTRTPDVDLDRLRRLFDELADNEIFVVDIVGGDIFARRDALAILEEMVSREFVFFLSTKALISRSTAERLGELSIGQADAPAHLRRTIQVSVDSTDPDVAAYLTANRRYFERATASVRNLVAAGLAPRVKCVLTGLNASAPQALVAHFVDLGVRDFQFVQYGRSHYRHREELFLSEGQKRALPPLFERLRHDYPDVRLEFQEHGEAGPPARKTQEQWAERSICSGGRISMLIQPNGDVTLCDQVPRAAPFVVGNVFDDGILAVWRSSKIEEFLYPQRKAFDGAVCFGCPDFDDCHLWQGYCYRDALFHYGSAFDAPPDCPRQSKVPLRAI